MLLFTSKRDKFCKPEGKMYLILFCVLAVARVPLAVLSETTTKPENTETEPPLVVTTPVAAVVEATTSKLIEPDIPEQICNVDAPFLMICKCKGQNFTHDNIVNTIQNGVNQFSDLFRLLSTPPSRLTFCAPSYTVHAVA